MIRLTLHRWHLLCAMLVALAAPTTRGETAMDTVRQRLVASYCTMDMTKYGDPAELCRSQRPDGTWKDVAYSDSNRAKWRAHDHLGRAMLLAQAFRLEPAAHADYATSARRALAWWAQAGLKNPNWWWNEIGVPRTLGVTMLLLGDALPEAERLAAMPIARRRVTQRTGQNLLWALGQQVIYAVLDSSDGELRDAYRQVAGLLVVEPLGKDGIQGDGSFHQHDRTLYSGGYGLSFACDAALLVAAADSTPYAVPRRNLDAFVSMLLDGTRWMVYGATFDYGACGRNITRRYADAPTNRLRDSGTLPTLRLWEVFQTMSKVGTGREREFATASQSMREGTGTQLGNRAFPASDLLIDHRRHAYVSVRTLSKRLANTDAACNGEGLRSRYLADGCTFLMRTGDEYHNIFPCWDWKRIPGTTVCRTDLKLNGGNARSFGTRSFSGALSDGEHGVATMDFARDGLVAHKTWFVGADGMLALGSAIRCTDAGPVETIVNQCRLTGPVAVTTADGQQELAAGTHNVPTPSTIEHGGFRYSFPAQAARLVVEISPEVEGDWHTINTGKSPTPTPETQDLLCIRLVHGMQPSEAAYQYSVHALADRQRSAIEQARTFVTPVCHASLSPTGSLLQAAFYTAGELAFQRSEHPCTLTVDRPCLVQLAFLPDGRVQAWTADPAHGDGPLALRLHQTDVLSATFPFPKGLAAGSTATQFLTH